MARRRNLTAIMRDSAPVTGAEPDPLRGQHFEDFLAPSSQYHFHPVTPLQAALHGPTEDDIDRQRSWVRETYGEEGLMRRMYHEHTDPGGKTFFRGDIIDE